MPERQKIALFNQQELEGKTVRGEREIQKINDSLMLGWLCKLLFLIYLTTGCCKGLL
jgi:hypothetical protein